MDNKAKLKTELTKKLKKETTVTGTGASVTPGVGAGVATKYAFGKRDNKGTPSDWKAAPSIPNRKSKAMDYKELWEEENEWPEEVLSRHRDMKFIKQKASSDKATYQIVDLENNNKPIGDMVFGSVKNLKDFADDYIKPQGGRQSTQLEEGKMHIGTDTKTDSDILFEPKTGAFYINVIDVAGNRTNKLQVNTIDDVLAKFPSWKWTEAGKAEFADSLDEASAKSATNTEELARVEELLAQANRDNAYSVMSSYEFRIKALRLLVALEKKYNTTLPFLKFGLSVIDYLNKYFPGFKGKFGPYNQNWKSVKDHIEQSMSQKQNMNEENLEEVIIPDNIKKFAQRKGVTNIVNQVARWAEKAGYSIVGGTAIGKDYSTLILDLTYQGSEVYINTDNDTIEVKGEEVDNYNSFVKALKEEMNEIGTKEEERMLTGGIPFRKESGEDYDKITITEPLPDDVKNRIIKKFLDAKWDAKPNNAGGITAVKKKFFVSDSINEETGFKSGKEFINIKLQKYPKALVKINQLIDMIGEDKFTMDVAEWVWDFFNNAGFEQPINEGYAQFRNETKTRTKPEQFHSAVKEVKKKVNEINRIFEYMNRLQSELSESEGGLKYKKYTEKAIQQIKESTKQLFFKSTKLK